MESYLLRGILIGLLFGMPAGAVGAITVQRTLNYGVKAGLLTGLGSSVADSFYAIVGAFGLTIISDFLLKYSNFINLSGGVLLFVMGIGMLFGKKKKKEESTVASSGAKLFLTSFSVGITNPAAILTFLFAFSWFGIAGGTGAWQGIQVVLGVFIGTYLWWTALSVGTNLLKKRVKENSLQNMNKIFGSILILFALIVLIKTIFNIH